MRLDKKAVKTICTGLQLKEIEKVDASNKDIDEVTVLPSLPQLLRLDISGNRLTSLEALSAHSGLKWLSIAHNGIDAVPPLDIPELQVLNVAGNKLSGKLRLQGVPKLRALIANDNAITAVKGLRDLPELNTVILKNNSVTALGSTVRGCTALVKLSVAHNDLPSLEETDLDGCASLAELRLGHNDLAALPAALSTCSRLKIVDLGSNRIVEVDDVKVLKSLPLLRQLTLYGCPVAKADDYADNVLRELPLVEQLDGRRVRDRIRGRLHGDGGPVLAAHAAAPKLARAKAGDDAARKRNAGGTEAAPDSGVQQREMPPSKRARTGKPTPEAFSSVERRRAEDKQQARHGDAAKRSVAQAGSAAAKRAAGVAADVDSDSEPETVAPSALVAVDNRPGQSFLDEVLEGTHGKHAAIGQDGSSSKSRANLSGVVKVIDVAWTQSGNATLHKLKQGRRTKGPLPSESGLKAAIRGTSAAQLLAQGELSMTAAGGSAAATAWD